MSLENVPVGDVVSSVVVPMIRALGAHGIRANLTPTENHVFRNEGTLNLALFPGGELSFFYTTGPTDDIPDRYMMAFIRGIPSGLKLTENDVTGAIQQFETDMIESGTYLGRTRVTEGGSFGDPIGRIEITNLIDSGSTPPPDITTIPAPSPDITKAPTTTIQETPQTTSSDANTDGHDTATMQQVEVPPAREPADVRETGPFSPADEVEITTSSNSGEKEASKKGCYIATAVYGGYDVPQVRVLRRFRDERLATSRAGRKAIRIYYKLSPTLAHHLQKQPWHQSFSRLALNAIVSRLQSMGISDATYSDREQ